MNSTNLADDELGVTPFSASDGYRSNNPLRTVKVCSIVSGNTTSFNSEISLIL